MKRFFPLVFFAFVSNLCLAQQDTIKHKEKNNCIRVYVGLSAFNQYGFDNLCPISLFPNVDALFGFPPGNDLLISFKHKKHEFVAGLYGTTYQPEQNPTKFFIFGGTTSYLYHFSKKKTHLFFEGNFKLYAYTSPTSDGYIMPYKSTAYRDLYLSGYQVNPASIFTMVIHPSIGVEVKLLKFIYYQFSIGSGVYRIKALSVYPQDPSYRELFTNTNIYNGKYGLDWYARMSIGFRIYNF